jgi:ABC-type molybdenum transport system ATPase subunit/photorepair protein PhrA
MNNKISFSSVHKSITDLNEIELPNFVVLTGVNGSGKTHLLTAIKEGKVRSSLVSDLLTDVRLFDSSTIIPTDTGVFDPFQDQSRRSTWFNVVQTHREQTFPSLQDYVIQQGVPATYCSSVNAIAALNLTKLREILNEPERAEEVGANIKNHIKNLGSQIYNHSISHIGDDIWRKTAPKVQQVSPESFLLSPRSTFFQNEHFLWGEVDPFQQAFGRVFTMYRELIHENDRLEKYPPKDDPSQRHLSSDEFIQIHKEPPWDFVNQILEECKLDFRVDHPPLHETTSYEPKLQKLSKPVEMRFQDLSSGEKVLMSFALCLYNAQENRQTKIFPKLLLLDEVDAPLHPSMVTSLLNTIQNVLVRDKNVSVILTTHSASTVALAPDSAIYTMNPNGPKIEKVNKSKALSILTSGVPTLSVSFDGRRQIFVESRTDASLYDRLFQRYKSYIESERSLVFVEVGKKDDSGKEQNAGCEQVIRLVDSLSSGGNQSVLGLIDWDGKRSCKERIHVLSQNTRDGLESLLFDPLLIAALIIRENKDFAKKKNLINENDTYTSIADWDQLRWQKAIECIQDIILDTSNSSNEIIEIKYLNNITLKIAKDYLHLDDHALEEKIIEKFGFLKPKNNRAGGLMSYIVETVLDDYPNLLPKDLLDTFKELLDFELTLE